MAEIDNYLVGPTTPDPDQNLGTAGDFAKTLGVGAAGVGSNAAGLLRYGWELGGSEAGADIAAGVQKLFAAAGDSIGESINPETKKLASSAMTSKEFWEHPVLATALKGTGMLPSVAALAIPGGLMADVAGASVMAAAGGAALNAGEGVDEFYQKLDGMSDKELQEQSPKYRAMREMMDEGPARARFNREAQGWGPAINAVIGSISGFVGPAGTAARGLAGGAKNAVVGAGERGVLGSAGLSTLEGAASNALEEGVQDITGQNAEMEADLRREFDVAKTANAAIEGAALGGLFGGAVGLATGGHKSPNTVKREVAKLDKAEEVVAPPTTTDVASPQPQTGKASAQAAKPLETAAVGNPQNEPTRSGTEGAKANKKTKAPKEPQSQEQPVDPAVAAAVAANEGTPVQAAPTEVAALTQLSPNETLDKLNGVQPQEAPQEVPQAAAPVTPQVTEQPLDTGMNVPEKPQSIAEQIAQIGQGERKAVMVPKGTVIPAALLGGRTDLKIHRTQRGRFIYDPKLTRPAEIQKLSAAGRENELLGLGPVSKPQAMADAAAGAAPVAVVERTPDGTEVKAAAGTTATLPEQTASLEAQKTPGNVVAVETPENVVEKRNAGGGRIINTNTENVTNTKFEDNEARAQVADERMRQHIAKAEAEEAGKGAPSKTNYRGERGRKRDAAIATAKEAVEAHQPNAEKERGAQSLPVPRRHVIERARAMVKMAEEKLGRPIQSQIKRSKDGTAASDSPEVLTLRIAKDLVKHENSAQINKLVTDFIADEFMIRAGHKDDVIARRLEEGNRAKQQTGGEHIEGKEDSDEGRAAIDEEDFAPVREGEDRSDDEAKGETGVSSVDADATVTPEGDISEHEASEAEVKQGPSVKHIKEVVNEKAKSNLSPREARKAALAKLRPAQIKNQMPMRAEAPMAPQQEALRVNRNPSEKQIEAGNYRKGHRRVEGMDFTIENPKGAMRRGRGPDGEWAVKMPADYGYLRRTTGADGEHVDAYDGRTGDRYFIIDQLDARTGEFDEHKVMMRFKDEAAAIDAYNKAFSDGRGPERMGYLHEVTTQELKDWLNNGNTAEPHIQHVVRDMDRVNFDVRPGQRAPHEAGNGVQVFPMRSTNAAAVLDNMNMSDLSGINVPLAKFFQARLRRLAGEAEVHFVTREDLDRLAPEAQGAVGLHVRNRQTGHSEIYLYHKLEEGGGFGTVEHVIMHELAHAATVREIEKVPGAEAMIQRLARAAYDHFNENMTSYDLELGPGTLDYAFTNAKEFVAEAFSNPKFQEFLSRVTIEPELARYLGVDRPGKMSAWDVLRKFVQKAIEKITGKLPTDPTALDGILKIGEHLTKIHEIDHPSPFANDRVGSLRPEKRVESEAFIMQARAADQVARLLQSREANESAPKALRLRTFDNIAQIAAHYFGENNPVQRIHNAIERQRVTGERIFEKSEPIVKKLAQLRAKNREQFEQFSELLHDATVADVHPDVPLTDAKNAHLGKDALKGVWSKARHQDLSKRFRALDAEFKEVWRSVIDHFTERQNSLSLGIINNQVLKLFGIEDGDLAKRIHEGNLTDADRARLGENLEVIEEAGELSKIHGPYVPLMRRGDHVVKGDYILKTPSNAKLVDGTTNEFEFTTRKEAEDYAKASSLQAKIAKIWIDPKTGERMGADELDSVDRYRVSVQNRHVEFIEGKRAAEARAAELAKDGSIAVHKVVPRSLELNARQGAELSTALVRLVKKLEHSRAYEAATPTQRATMRQAIEEAALASHGSTRVSSRALPRRSVAGYSEDLVQNTVDYGMSSSRYLAKLEHAPELERGLKDMAEQLDRDHSKQGQYARTAISNEVRQRVEGENGFQQGGKFSQVVKRALSASFTDKLASPAYSIINAMQPGMVTMPYLSARFGVGRTFSAMGKAYSDINSGSLIKAGAKGTLSQVKKSGGAGDLMQRVMKNLSADEKAMIQYQLDVGTIDANAGMEVHDLAKSYTGAGGKIDATLGYLEGVTREMPRAIETINRSVTALAAYRLERSKGASHDAATAYAQQAVNNTQFNYSPTNSPGVFNHPLLKLALQFKKYGQGMYQLIGTQIGDAIRNAEPGDRQRAVKTLIGIAATHMAMAGALGLPTEPFKYLVMAASPFTGKQWSDVENEIRRMAGAMFGKTGGEVVTRGLPRFLNLDLQRMGLDSVTSFGEPRGQKEADVKSWLFDSVSGPVVSLGGDYIKGLNHLANGEITKAAEKMIPLKAASDSIRAYRQYSEGKKSAKGKQTSEPYSPTEAGLRALGFGTARESEEGAANTAYFRQSGAAKETRNALVNDWVSAQPASKMKAWAAIQKYNQSAPAESKITAKELTDKARREAKAGESSTRGINPNKRDKRFLDNSEAIYNLR